MRSNTLPALFVVFGILSLFASGCALDAPAIDWQHGAKRGRIVGFFSADDAGAAGLPVCLAGLPKETLAAGRFVKVTYRHVRQVYSEVAQLPLGSVAKIDDTVELWPQDCASGKLSRIARMLPAVSP